MRSALVEKKNGVSQTKMQFDGAANYNVIQYNCVLGLGICKQLTFLRKI